MIKQFNRDMNMNPLVSIIVPIYNAEKYLKECIESILNQTYKNIQIILVNDGSTDKSLEICKNFASVYSKIIIINQINAGVSAARNHGIEFAEGEYIGFVDSDDYINTNMIKSLLNSIVIYNADACVLMNHTIKPVSRKILNCTKLDNCEAIRELFLLRFPSSVWAYLYKKEIIKNVRLNDSIHFFEDFEFNYRVLTNVKSVALCYDNFYFYRAHDLSTNNQSINNKKMTCLEIFDLHKENIHKLDCNLVNYSIFFRSHFLISVIMSILKANDIDRKYTKTVNLKAKKIHLDVINSKYVPLSYKLAITIFLINPHLLKLIKKLKI